MEKTKRTLAGHMLCFCKISALLLPFLLFSTNRASSQCTMTCHNINLSLDTMVGGQTIISPESVLNNGSISCPDGSFEIKMYDPFGGDIGNVIDCRWVGYTLIAKVNDLISGNSCWAKVKVEDKSGPNITCGKDTISCLALNSISQGADKFPLGSATDNCSTSSQVSFVLICTDLPCTNTSFVAICVRTVIATDQWGSTSQCTDSLWIAKDSIQNVIGAKDTMIACNIIDTIAKDANGNPIPQRVGIPTIKGYPVWPNYSVCKIISSYSDVVYPICGKSRKIRRQWRITDWCTKRDTLVTQWIKITDNTPPSASDLNPITVNLGAHDCNAAVTLVRPSASDCSGIQSITYTAVILNTGTGGGLPTILNGYFVSNYVTVFLPSGTDTILYTITDSCSNRTEIVQVVNVIDGVPPTPVCDQRTVTTLDPAQCWARVYAEDLDNGSHDNCCSILYFSIIQMDSLTKYRQLLVNKVKSKYGESLYNNKQAFFNLLIDKYINCKYFDDYVDLGDCGDKQVVLRVSEACKIPLYDPHVDGDSRHSFYCKAAYASSNGYSNDLGTIDEFIKSLLGNEPASYGDLDITLGPRNYNDCMVWINVQDKQAPTCQVDPVKYVYCDGVPYQNNSYTSSESYYSKNELNCQGANGKYDPDYLTLDKYDTGGKIDPYAQFDEASIKDNCGSVTITSKTTGSINNCGAGTLTRTWTGTDKCGQLSTSCSQKLILLHRSDFAVLFPNDIETDCLDKISQLNTPTGDMYPKIFDDDCEQVGISFQDTRYEIATDACFKIVRIWKLIDWCTYDPDKQNHYPDFIVDTAAVFRASANPVSSRYCSFRYLKDNGDGYITYTQVIKVNNKVAPTIVKVDSVVTCAGNSATCVGHIKLKVSGSDDCTPLAELKWTILIDSLNDGSVNKVIEGVGATAGIDGDFPVGKHKITFFLRDLCGNDATRVSVVDVKLCKKPTPHLLNGLAADLMPIDANKDGKPETGMLVIWAKDFDAGSYSACGQKIVSFSFTSDTTQKSVTYTCDSLGQRFVNVWVTDSYGNQDFGRTYILIQDNNKACTGGVQAISASINGLIKTDEKLQIENVQVSLEGSTAVPSITKSDGAYAFSNMQVGGNYKIMPKKNINPMNGVSTLDLLLIQKHILGVQYLTSPYRLIAADINKSNDISSVDLVELRKLILGVYDNFQGNESWRFVPANYKFKNEANPFDGGFPEYHSINQITQSISADFVGIKIGDVNGSVTPNQLMGGEVRSPGKELVLTMEEQSLTSKDIIQVPIFLGSSGEIQGFQFTISFDAYALEFLDATPLASDMTKANFGTQKATQGILTTSFSTMHPIGKSDKALFVLSFRTLKSSQLSEVIHFNSKLTAAEAYNRNNEVMAVRLDVNTTAHSMSYALLQNQPNPFLDMTRIGFVLPQAGKADLTLYDLSGRALKSVSGQYQKGFNEIKILKSDLQATGVFYYQLHADGFTATRKMIVME